eukprot:g2489.t1
MKNLNEAIDAYKKARKVHIDPLDDLTVAKESIDKNFDKTAQEINEIEEEGKEFQAQLEEEEKPTDVFQESLFKELELAKKEHEFVLEKEREEHHDALVGLMSEVNDLARKQAEAESKALANEFTEEMEVLEQRFVDSNCRSLKEADEEYDEKLKRGTELLLEELERRRMIENEYSEQEKHFRTLIESMESKLERLKSTDNNMKSIEDQLHDQCKVGTEITNDVNQVEGKVVPQSALYRQCIVLDEKALQVSVQLEELRKQKIEYEEKECLYNDRFVADSRKIEQYKETKRALENEYSTEMKELRGTVSMLKKKLKEEQYELNAMKIEMNHLQRDHAKLHFQYGRLECLMLGVETDNDDKQK